MKTEMEIRERLNIAKREQEDVRKYCDNPVDKRLVGQLVDILEWVLEEGRFERRRID